MSSKEIDLPLYQKCTTCFGIGFIVTFGKMLNTRKECELCNGCGKLYLEDFELEYFKEEEQ